MPILLSPEALDQEGQSVSVCKDYLPSYACYFTSMEKKSVTADSYPVGQGIDVQLLI